MGILDTLKNIIGAKPKPSPAQTNAETPAMNKAPEPVLENKTFAKLNEQFDAGLKERDRLNAELKDILDKQKELAPRQDEQVLDSGLKTDDDSLAELKDILKRQQNLSAEQDKQLSEANEVLRIARPSNEMKNQMIRDELRQISSELKEPVSFKDKETEEDIPVPGDELKQPSELKKHKSDRGTISQIIK